MARAGSTSLTFDPWVKRARIDLAPEETLEFVPQWMIDRLEWLADEHAARISLNGPSEPAALEGIDASRSGRDMLPYLPNSSEVVNRRTTSWCVAPAPTRGWAELVYPELPADEALRPPLAGDGARVPARRGRSGRRRGNDAGASSRHAADRLTERRFDAIHLHGPGTDLTVGLFRSSAWHAGDSETVDGIRHFSNIPTEEAFTTPDPTRVDGVVTATRPLVMHGSLIDGIRVEFEGGRAVRIDAERGADALRAATARDEGASRLGELALVDGSGRIGPLDTVFWETLIDENAATHIALGSAYLSPGRGRGGARAGQPQPDPRRLHDRQPRAGGRRDHRSRGEHVPVLRGGEWQV